MLYTSYFGNLNKIKKNIEHFNNPLICSISNQKPQFLDDTILDWSFLGPTKDLLYLYKQGKIDENIYTLNYLNNINLNWVELNKLFKSVENRDVIMLCYEKPDKFCHRHLLSVFINEKGYKCKELTI